MAKWEEVNEVTDALKIMMLGAGVSGKSTVERGLRGAGFNVVPEAARDVIEQYGVKGPAVQRLIYHRQQEHEIGYVKSGTNVLDRGLVDLPVYAEYFGIPNLPGIDGAITRADYHNIALLLCVPPDEKTFNMMKGDDPARFETYDIACQLEEITRIKAPEYGITLWDVAWEENPQDKVDKVVGLVRKMEKWKLK